MCFAPSLTAPPAIVAESLVGVPDPLLTALSPGTPESGTVVANSIARSLAPPEHLDPIPQWLLPEQERSFRRALAAVRRHGGALLADPVGSGKTYVALAVAGAINRGSTVCLVPASLLAQWKRAADRVGIPATLCSHQQVSRGRLPTNTRGLVIIDESHHFRNHHTRRYQHLAPWLVGRPALLVSATPIVNRLVDLAYQLLLAVRDNALAMDGIVSLRALLDRGCPAPALGQLVLEHDAVTDRRPRKSYRIRSPSLGECSATGRLIDASTRLRLSRCEPIAALIRGVLLRAIGSSPAALTGALRRYRRLLLHARDALTAGRALERAELRHFTGELNDQLIWWELLPLGGARPEIELSDLPELEETIRVAQAASEGEDGKLAGLRDLLIERVPTLVFTISRDTVRYVRDRLGHLRLAWCTGERAGIGAMTLPRRAVLGWFREPVNSSLAPHHLIVTDVAAEGLDLQRAARVVHYDLPWTPTRLEQREGRSVRYGSRYSEVEVVRFAAPSVLERSLGLEATLARKAKLPAIAGLGPAGRRIWRWRAEQAERFSSGEARSGVAAVPAEHMGLLAGFSLYNTHDLSCLSATVLWFESNGVWTDAPEIVTERLASAEAQSRILPVDSDQLRKWLAVLAASIRERLTLILGRRWIGPEPTPASRHLASRLQRLVREAARKHQASRLAELERALGFVTGGHTAGEAALVERLAESSDRELAAAVGRLPPVSQRWDGIEVRLSGLVLFGPAKATGGALVSSECRNFTPPSLT